jgi:hypothetical protein
MGEFRRYEIKSSKGCCSNTQVIFETNFSLTKENYQPFINAGFSMNAQFFNAGIFLFENKDITIICTLGSNSFKINKKFNGDVDKGITLFESIIGLM